MSKKKFLIGLLFVIIVVIAVDWLASPGAEVSQQVLQISGRVTAVDENSVTITGLVEGREKIVVFNITDNTLVRNSRVTITEEQLTSGKPYTPEIRLIEVGKENLAVGQEIVKVTTKDNLSQVSSAEALEIIYLEYELPQISR